MPLKFYGTAASVIVNHNLLSATHPDTLSDNPIAGDLVIGNNTPKWARLSVGTDGQFLTLVSGLPSWQNPVTADVQTSGDFNTVVTNPTFADVTDATLTITPRAGTKVLAIAKTVCWNAAATDAMSCRLVYGAGPTLIGQVYVPGVISSSREHGMIVGVVTGLSGATTFKLQANRDTASGTATVGAQTKIVVLSF